MQIIARIHSDFPDKFGLPRQSGLVPELTSLVVFEPEYRVADALRGMEGFSHLWILWQFHLADREGWSPTVRPPRLGGNTRMGVFATRSPFRPNPIGLSCVKLVGIEERPGLGHVLVIAGADMADGTPVYDIKPYLPYADSHPEATGGFADPVREHALEVVFPDELKAKLPNNLLAGLIGVLAQDPRPGYQRTPGRAYGFRFAAYEVRFEVTDDVLTVLDILPAAESK